jgi:pimeloyl-ACP methyl ester carboxylesterase
MVDALHAIDLVEEERVDRKAHEEHVDPVAGVDQHSVAGRQRAPEHQADAAAQEGARLLQRLGENLTRGDVHKLEVELRHTEAKSYPRQQTMPDFSSGGVGLHYYLDGPEDGKPTVLVHGFASNFQVNWVGSRWVETMTRAGRRMIGLDLRGHGRSDKPHDPEAYGGAMVEDVANLLDQLDLDTVDYVGYSMGSQIGLRLLVAHPERVRRAVTGGIGMNVTTPWRAGEAIARRLRGEVTEESAAAVMFHQFALAVPKNDLEALACCITGRSTPLGEEQLAAIQTPVLVAVGGADPIARDAQKLAELLPQGEFFEVPDRDHATAVPSRAIKERAVEFLDQD